MLLAVGVDGPDGERAGAAVAAVLQVTRGREGGDAVGAGAGRRVVARRGPVLVEVGAAAALEQLKKLYIEPKPVETQPGEKTSPRLYPTRRENLLTPNTKVELSTNVPTADTNNVSGE